MLVVLGLVGVSRVALRSRGDATEARMPGPPPVSVAPATPAATPATLAPSAAPSAATPAPTLPPPTRAPVPARAGEARPGPTAPPPASAAVALRSGPTPAPLRVPEAPVAPAEPPSPAVDAGSGTLRLHVVPWAEVSLDGQPIGTTPLKPLFLAPGAHTVRLLHPDYRPLQKKVNVRPGEVFVLEVDLAEEAFPIPAKER